MDIVDISVVDTVDNGVGAVDALEPTSLGFNNVEKRQKYFSGYCIFQVFKTAQPNFKASTCYTSEQNSNIILQYTSVINLLPVVVPSVEVVVKPSS